MAIEVDGSNSPREMTLLLVPSSLYPQENFLSAVVDIKLFDSSGNEIKQFSSSAKVCFSSSSSDREEICLAYFDEKSNKWECEDTCLTKEDDLFWFVSVFFVFFSPVIINDVGKLTVVKRSISRTLLCC